MRPSSASFSTSIASHPSEFVLDTHSVGNSGSKHLTKRAHSSDSWSTSLQPGSVQKMYRETTFAATRYGHALFTAVRQYEEEVRARRDIAYLERSHKWSVLRDQEERERMLASQQIQQKRTSRERRLAMLEEAAQAEIRAREAAEGDERRMRIQCESRERELRGCMRYAEWFGRVTISFEQRSRVLQDEEMAIRMEASGHFLFDVEARYRNFIFKLSTMVRTQLLAQEKAQRITQLKYLHKLWGFRARQEGEVMALSASERKLRAKIAEEESSRFSMIDVEKITLLADLARKQRRACELLLLQQKAMDEMHSKSRDSLSFEDAENRADIRQEEAALRAIFREQHLVQRAEAEAAFQIRIAAETSAWLAECARQQAPVFVSEEHARRSVLAAEQEGFNDVLASHQELWQAILKPIATNVCCTSSRYSPGAGVLDGGVATQGGRWVFPFQSVIVSRKTTSSLYPSGACTDLRLEVMGVRGVHAGDEVDIPTHFPVDFGLNVPQRSSKDKALPREMLWSLHGQKILDGNGNVVCYFGSERTAGIAARGGSDEETLTTAMSASALTLFWAEVSCGSNANGTGDTLRLLNRLLSLIGFRCDATSTNVDSRELKLRVRGSFSLTLAASNHRLSAARRRRSTSPMGRAAGSHSAASDDATNSAEVFVSSFVHMQAPVLYFGGRSMPLNGTTNTTVASAQAIPMFFPLSQNSADSDATQLGPVAEGIESQAPGSLHALLKDSIQKGVVEIPADTSVSLSPFTTLATVPKRVALSLYGTQSLNSRYVSFSASYVEASAKSKIRVMPFSEAIIEPGEDFASFTLRVKMGHIAGADDNITFVGVCGGPAVSSSDISAPWSDAAHAEGGGLTSSIGVITENYILKRNELMVSAVLQAIRETGTSTLSAELSRFDVQGRFHPAFPVSSRELTVSGARTPRLVVMRLLRQIGAIVDGKSTRARTLEAHLSFSGLADGVTSGPPAASSLIIESAHLMTEIIPTTLVSPSIGASSHATSFYLSLPHDILANRVYVDNTLGLPSWYGSRATVNRMQLFNGACVARSKGRLRAPGESSQRPSTPIGSSPRSGTSASEMMPPCTVTLSIDQGATVGDSFLIDFSTLAAPSTTPTVEPLLCFTSPFSSWRIVVDGQLIRYATRSEGASPVDSVGLSTSFVVAGAITYTNVRQCKLQPELSLSLKSMPSEIFSALLQSLTFSTRVSVTSENALKLARLTISPPTAGRGGSLQPGKGSFLPYTIPVAIVAGGQRVRVSQYLSNEIQPQPSQRSAVPVIRLSRSCVEEPVHVPTDSSPTCTVAPMSNLEPLRLDERAILPQTWISHVSVSFVDGPASISTLGLGGSNGDESPLAGSIRESSPVCGSSGLMLLRDGWAPVSDGGDGFTKSSSGMSAYCHGSASVGSAISFTFSCESSPTPMNAPLVAAVLRSVAYRHDFDQDVALLKTLLVRFTTGAGIVEECLVQIDVQPIFLPSYFAGMDGAMGASNRSGCLPSECTGDGHANGDDLSTGDAILPKPSSQGIALRYVGTSLLHNGSGGVMRLFPDGVVADEDTTSCGEGFLILEALEGMRPGDRLTLLPSPDLAVESFGGSFGQGAPNGAHPTECILDAESRSILADCYSDFSQGAESLDLSCLNVGVDSSSPLESSAASSRIIFSVRNKTLLSDCTRLLRLLAFTREDPFGYVEPHSIRCLLRFNARDEIVSDTRFAFTIDVQTPPLYTLPVERTVRTSLHGSRLRPLAHLRLALPGHHSVGTSLFVSSDDPLCGIFLRCPHVFGNPQSASGTSRRDSLVSISEMHLPPEIFVDLHTGNVVCNFALAVRLSGVNTVRPTPGVDGVVLGRVESIISSDAPAQKYSRPSSAISSRSSAQPALESEANPSGSHAGLFSSGGSALSISLEPNVPCSLLRVILRHIGVDTAKCRSNPCVSLHWAMRAQIPRNVSKDIGISVAVSDHTFVSHIVCDVEGEAAGVSVIQPSDRFIAFDGCPVRIFNGLVLAKSEQSDDEHPDGDAAASSGAALTEGFCMSTQRPISPQSAGGLMGRHDPHSVVAVEVAVIGARTADNLQFPETLLPSRKCQLSADDCIPVPSRGNEQSSSPQQHSARRDLRSRGDDAVDQISSPCGENDHFTFSVRTDAHVKIAFSQPQPMHVVSGLLHRATFSGMSRLSGPVRLLQATVYFSSGRIVTRQAQVSLKPKAVLVPIRPRQMPSVAGDPLSILRGAFVADQKLLGSSSFEFSLLTQPRSKGRAFDRLAVLVPDGLIANRKQNTIHLGVAVDSDAPITDRPSNDTDLRMGPPLVTVSSTTDRDLRIVFTGASALTFTTLTSLLESIVLVYSDDRSPGLQYDVNAVADLTAGGARSPTRPLTVDALTSNPNVKRASKGGAFSGASGPEVAVRVSWECEVDRNSAFSSGNLIRDEAVILFAV